MHRRVSILVKGKVQGVFFRQSAKEAAEDLGLRGWVKNLPGGEVAAVAEGPAEQVERFIGWCRVGPPSARVSEVRVEDDPGTAELVGFRVEEERA